MDNVNNIPGYRIYNDITACINAIRQVVATGIIPFSFYTFQHYYL